MELDKAIENRSSVRSFKSKNASWKLVLEAIDSAIKAPFPVNQNHLKFLIIEDANKIKKLAEFSNQLWINEAPIVVVVCSDDNSLEDQFGERGRVYSRQAAGAAIENFLLKITDLGLSSCWVGAYTDELIKQSLKIPSHVQIEAILPVGYASEKPEKKKKSKLENVLRWEDWDTYSRPPLYQEAPHKRPDRPN